MLATPAMSMTEAECTRLWAAITGFGDDMRVSTGAVAIEDGWCVGREVRLGSTTGNSVYAWADVVRLRGPGYAHLILGEVPQGGANPLQADLQVEGYVQELVSRDVISQYLLRAQSRPKALDVAVSVQADSATRILDLTRLDVDFPGDNAISVTGKARNVDLSTPAAQQMSLSGFAVTDLGVSIRSNGLFEDYALWPLGYLVLGGPTDPEVQVAALKLQGQAIVASLPDETFAPAAKAALAALISEMPNPAGTLDLSLRSEAGVGPARFAGYAITGVPGTVAGFGPLFDGVVINMEWQHDPVE